MPAGIEIYTADNHLQLTDNNIYFRLEQKVVLDNTGWAQYGNNGSYRDVTFTGPGSGDAPMLALASQAATWHRQISSTSTSVTYRVYRTSAGGYSVTCYLFSKRPPPDSNMPFCIFNDAGQCVFNANYPPARPIGTFSAGTYTGLDRTGRSLAFVPQKRAASQYILWTYGGAGSCQLPGGINGYQAYQQTGWSETALNCWGEAISWANFATQVGPIPHSCAGSSNQYGPGSGSETQGYSALILDVTGY